MRKAILYSTALHAMVIAVAWLGVPSLFRPPPPIAPPIAVELVTDQPAEKPKPKPPAPKPRPPRAEAPPAPPPPAPEIPPPPQTALAVPEPAPEPPPPPPKAKPKPKPEPKPKAEPKPKPAPVKQIAAPAPRPRPKPPPREPKAKPKPKPDELQALLKNLAQQKAQRAREQKQAARAPEPTIPRPAPTPQRTALETRQLEQILIRAVRQQLTPCWNIPAGAKDAEAMQVGIRIRLGPDGTLRGAPVILDTSRLATDPFYRAVAESAVRALLNPECRPLRLPIDQYDIWKEITFNFDPGEALGR